MSCVRQGYYDLLEEYPDDVDAMAFFAWYLIDRSIGRFGAPLQPLRVEAQALLAKDLALHPWHHGLAHYLIHAWEDTLRPDMAISVTEAILSKCGRSPHMIHMVGHVQYLLGHYQQASAYFSASRFLEVCPESTLNGTVTVNAFLAHTGPHMPPTSCNALFSLPSNPLNAQSWCYPVCNSSLHHWEIHHNIAFQIMTLSQIGQLSAVAEWAEVGLAMRPWEVAAMEMVPFPLLYSPLASRALARYYYQSLLAPVDAYLSAGMWKRAQTHAARVIRHVQAHQRSVADMLSAQAHQSSIVTSGSSNNRVMQQYVFSSAKYFATIPLSLYASKGAYAALMGSVFVDRDMSDSFTQPAVANSTWNVPILGSVDAAIASQHLEELTTHVTFLNASLSTARRGDLSYSVIERNIKAVLCSLAEAQGLVAFAQGHLTESITMLRAAKDMTAHNSSHSILMYNEPVVIPRPIAESLGAVYEHAG